MLDHGVSLDIVGARSTFGICCWISIPQLASAASATGYSVFPGIPQQWFIKMCSLLAGIKGTPITQEKRNFAWKCSSVYKANRYSAKHMWHTNETWSDQTKVQGITVLQAHALFASWSCSLLLRENGNARSLARAWQRVTATTMTTLTARLSAKKVAQRDWQQRVHRWMLNTCGAHHGMLCTRAAHKRGL